MTARSIGAGPGGVAASVTGTAEQVTGSHQLHGRIAGLDGLRAIAVLAVLVYHLRPEWLPGGFLGVDVFFVVSGFLITTLALRELVRTGRLRFGAFWLRRARRLLPALGVVVIVSIVAARLVQPDLLVGIGRQTLGAATFSSNWLEIAAGNSYFDDSAPVLFQTFWSLAIEEQFYLVWPPLLVLLLILTPGGRSRATVAALGAFASAAAMALRYAPGTDPTRVYYGLDTHVFGLLMGVCLAFAWTTRRQVLLSRWAITVVPVLAVAGLVALLVLVRDDSPWTYRGGIALASVLAALAVAGCTGRVTPLIRVLELRPLVWVGARSYGIYLWHWPIILIVGAAAAAQPGTGRWWTATAMVLVLTLGLSAASFRWVETPIRRDGFRAVGREVARAVRPPGAVAARVTAGAAVLALLGAGAAVATAPQMSAAERSVLDGQAALERAQREAEAQATPRTPGAEPTGAGPPSPNPGSGTTAPPSPDPSADPSPDPAPDMTPEHLLPEGPQISAFGDSVLSGAAPAMFGAFPGISIDAEPIRQWGVAPDLVRASADAGTLRPFVVLGFGTNAGLKSPADQDALRATLDLIGPERRVVLVNVVGISYWVDDTNATMDQIAAEYPNVEVADWRGAVRDRPGLLHSDNTHPTAEGTAVYADVVRTALEQVAAS
ncbi:MAG: acyltransferase family protein [Cellulomonadaceae bacterium]